MRIYKLPKSVNCISNVLHSWKSRQRWRNFGSLRDPNNESYLTVKSLYPVKEVKLVNNCVFERYSIIKKVDLTCYFYIDNFPGKNRQFATFISKIEQNQVIFTSYFQPYTIWNCFVN